MIRRTTCTSILRAPPPPVKLLKMVFAVGSLALLLASLTALALARPLSMGDAQAPLAVADGAAAWTLDGFKSLVTFGDSFTDESRASYFGEHGRPPTGWMGPVSRQTAVGGYVWPRWVSWYTRSNSYNYAVSGAECSTAITPRNNRFQGIKEYEVDAFVADLAHRVGGRPFLEAAPETTVYASWIGTNDLGAGAFLTGEQAPGKTRDDYVACVFETFDRLYAAGGRRFVLMNVIPLDQLPLYGLPERGGLAWSKYWPDKPANLTATSLHMKEIVEYVNGAFKVRMGRMKASKKYPGAQMALFDVWKLFNNMYQNPTAYFNGTEPANATGSVLTCGKGTGCVASPSPDSYLWFDELHPSEQASRLLANEFVKLLSGKSRYASYLSL